MHNIAMLDDLRISTFPVPNPKLLTRNQKPAFSLSFADNELSALTQSHIHTTQTTKTAYLRATFLPTPSHRTKSRQRFPVFHPKPPLHASVKIYQVKNNGQRATANSYLPFHIRPICPI
jgi:hypothetical protein